MPADLQRTVRPKILVADDEPNWLRVLSLYLRGRQCDVTTALDGHEAMQKIRQDRPDLIIADITMPGMDGYELCRRLRRDAATRTIPFIFLTARDHEAERVKARRIGADEYLTKPCSLDRVVQSVDTAMERIEQAKKLSLERIGWSGRIEDVDILDFVQALELEQRTGALVLSHGERTGSIYLKEGVIVEADIRSPAREEPLFRLLGWKTGRFAFIPDAVPEQTPITASMANLLFEDLRLLEEHARNLMQSPVEEIPAEPAQGSATGPDTEILALLESVGKRYASTRIEPASPMVLRILVVGTVAGPAGELIQGLVMDLSGSKWAALERQDHAGVSQMEIGRIRLSARLALHLVAVRGEQRFWPIWEEYLPESIGTIFMLNGMSEEERAGLRSYLIARDNIAPSMPVVVSLPPVEPAETAGERDSETPFAGIPADRRPELIPGAYTLAPIRLRLLSRLLQRWLALNGE
jgi:CheY-like chemotaxis protein